MKKYKVGDVISWENQDDHRIIAVKDGKVTGGRILSDSVGSSWVLEPHHIGAFYRTTYRVIRVIRPRRPVKKHNRFRQL